MRHTLYEQWQGNYSAAYSVAEYYQQRGQGAPELTLAQAAASLELGYLSHGRALINDLDEGSLLPENQSRLHLYLARDAYRRRDWLLLNEHLVKLKPLQGLDGQQRYYDFLQAEAARHEGQSEIAELALGRLPKHDPLRFYGLFNLAVSVDEDPVALRLLQELVGLPAQDYEQRMLSERGRIALADLHLKLGDRDAAHATLAKVTASEQYGPLALARLARLDMQAQQYANAAAIWHYLIESYPWHRAATEAPSGLGYALLQVRGEEAAYGSYLNSVNRIEQQQIRLQQFRSTLSENLRNPNWIFAEQDSEQSLMAWLADGLGHDDWTGWLSDASVQQAATRWQSLSRAYAELKNRQRDLEILLAVDSEQQNRIRSAQASVIGQGLDRANEQIQKNITKQLAALRQQTVDFNGPLNKFATAEELQLLEQLESLAKSPGAATVERRIQRLIGLVRYAIHDSIPVRRQTLIADLQQQLMAVELAAQRIDRIEAAAEQLVATDSVSGQISTLASDTALLTARTQSALGMARGSLIAGLDEFIGRDETLLANQMHGLQYDITRLIDRQVAEVRP